MDDKRFDKRLKDLLDGHRESVPEALWDRVAPAGRERKRGVAWWAYAGMLLFLAGGLGYTVYKWGSGQKGDTTLTTPLPDAQPSPSASPSPSPSPSSRVSTQSATPSGSVTKPSTTVPDPQPSAAPVGTTGSGTAVTDVSQGTGVIITAQGPVREPEHPTDEQGKAGAGTASLSPSASGWISIPMLTGLLPDAGQWHAWTALPRPESVDAPDPGPGEETDEVMSASPRGLSLEFLIAPELPFKHLSGKDAHYRNIRDESELHYSAYSMSLYLHARFNRFFIRTGIQYSTIYERLSVEVTDGFISQVLVDSLLKGFILDPFQSTQPYSLVDTVFSYTYNEFQHRDRNRYTFINIPVSAGYNLSSRKFEFYATAGLSLNLATRAEGLIIAPDSVHLLMLDDKRTTPFRTQAGLSATASMGLAYRLYPKLTFLFEPAYRTHLMSITTDSHPLRQKYGVIGINVGLRMDF